MIKELAVKAKDNVQTGTSARSCSTEAKTIRISKINKVFTNNGDTHHKTVRRIVSKPVRYKVKKNTVR